MADTITLREFAEKIRELLTVEFGDGFEISINEVVKNNDTTFTGVVIRKMGGCIAPTIYLERFFEEFIAGSRDLSDIVSTIRQIYEENSDFPLEEFKVMPFEDVKDKIIMNLSNTAMNEKRLTGAPHREILDLSVSYRILVEKGPWGMASSLVVDDLLYAWGVSEEDLFAVAKKNTERLMPLTITSLLTQMRKLLGEFSEDMEEMEEMEKMFEIPDFMWVLSNMGGLNGAVSILYEELPDCLREFFGENLPEEFILIPSSVHEVILVENNGEGLDFLTEMIREVNMTQVERPDILSDHPYILNSRTGELRMY